MLLSSEVTFIIREISVLFFLFSTIVDMQCTQRYVSSFCLTVFFSMLFYQIEDSRYYLMNLLFDWWSLWRIYADWRAGPIDWNLRPHHRFKPASFGLCKNKWNNVYKIPCMHFIWNLDFLKKNSLVDLQFGVDWIGLESLYWFKISLLT